MVLYKNLRIISKILMMFCGIGCSQCLGMMTYTGESTDSVNPAYHDPQKWLESAKQELWFKDARLKLQEFMDNPSDSECPWNGKRLSADLSPKELVWIMYNCSKSNCEQLFVLLQSMNDQSFFEPWLLHSRNNVSRGNELFNTDLKKFCESLSNSKPTQANLRCLSDWIRELAFAQTDSRPYRPCATGYVIELKPPLDSPMPSSGEPVMSYKETLHPPSGTKRNGDDECMMLPPSKRSRIG